MFKVFIVDDEPPFIRAVTRAIELLSEGFEVVGFAYNGKEALDKIEEAKPDVVITDIKMPVMDGIVLLKELHKNYPEMQTMVLSGYQDFEYAKQALKVGVIDYLLKPIDNVQFSEAMKTISEKLKKKYQEIEEAILDQLSTGEEVPARLIRRHFDYPYFQIVVVLSGLYIDTSKRIYYLSENKINTILQVEELYGVEKKWIMELAGGRQVMMLLAYGSADEKPDQKHLKALYDKLAGKQPITFCCSDVFKNLPDLSKILVRMDSSLKRNVIIDYSQLIRLEHEDKAKTSEFLLDEYILNRLEVLIKARNTNMLNDEIHGLLEKWSELRCLQINVERAIRQILMLVRRYALDKGYDLIDQFDETLPYSKNYEDIYISLSNILSEHFTSLIQDHTSKSSDELMKRIDKYIISNMNRMITLQDVCDYLNISQPYLSKIVRKERQTSFNEYVTKIKIDAAKKYFAEFPDMLIKDVAEVVGYEDQHYFSRVFKYITGKSPSNFRKTLE